MHRMERSKVYLRLQGLLCVRLFLGRLGLGLCRDDGYFLVLFLKFEIRFAGNVGDGMGFEVLLSFSSLPFPYLLPFPL